MKETEIKKKIEEGSKYEKIIKVAEKIIKRKQTTRKEKKEDNGKNTNTKYYKLRINKSEVYIIQFRYFSLFIV